MIEIEVSPVVAAWFGFRQFSESKVEPDALLASAERFAKERPTLARDVRDALLPPLGLRLLTRRP